MMGGGSYLCGVAGFLVYFLLFIFVQRLPLKIGWFLLEILLGIIVFIFSAMAGYRWISSFSIWYQASIYAFLWLCFFFTSSIYSVSVSLGIIRYLYEQPDKVATLSDINEKCIIQPFEERAAFLVATKQAQMQAGCYLPTAAGRSTVKNLRLIQKILGMKSHGFYSEAPELIKTE